MYCAWVGRRLCAAILLTVVSLTRLVSATGTDCDFGPELPLLRDLELGGHPGPVSLHRAAVVIPAGYQGLLVWEPAESNQ